MITIRPETEGNLLVVEASETLTARDYEQVFIPKLDEMIQQHGKIRVVFHLNDSFRGWDLGAMWDDARFGVKHKNDFERIAMVGGPKWVTWITRMSAHFMHGSLKVFESGLLPEAIAWAKE